MVSCAMDQRWTDSSGFRNCTCQMNLQPPFILGNGLQNPCLALRENVVKEVQSVNFPLHLLVTKARATAIQLTPTFFSLQYGAIYSRVFLKVCCPGNSFSILLCLLHMFQDLGNIKLKESLTSFVLGLYSAAAAEDRGHLN